MDYNGFWMQQGVEMENVCTALLSAVSIMRFQSVTQTERENLDSSVRECFRKLDALGVTFCFQNAVLYMAETHDVRREYVRPLLDMAIDRAGGTENIFKRI